MHQTCHLGAHIESLPSTKLDTSRCCLSKSSCSVFRKSLLIVTNVMTQHVQPKRTQHHSLWKHSHSTSTWCFEFQGHSTRTTAYIHDVTAWASPLRHLNVNPPSKTFTQSPLPISLNIARFVSLKECNNVAYLLSPGNQLILHSTKPIGIETTISTIPPFFPVGKWKSLMQNIVLLLAESNKNCALCWFWSHHANSLIHYNWIRYLYSVSRIISTH